LPVLKATDRASAIDVLASSQAALDGLLVDYHVDEGDGVEAIRHLRERFGPDLTAVLIRADRSPHVREAARTNETIVLNKPVKPAALRALLTR
jgi:CheY-like chemotaxis protein